MHQQKLPPTLLVGCETMGNAMLTGWIERGVEHVIVVRPSGAPAARAHGAVVVCSDVSDIPSDFSPAVVVFATKPQLADQVMPNYSLFTASGAVALSIMAGKTISGIDTALGGKARVVRAMPNTPATVRCGFTCAFAGPRVTVKQTPRTPGELTSMDNP